MLQITVPAIKIPMYNFSGSDVPAGTWVWQDTVKHTAISSKVTPYTFKLIDLYGLLLYPSIMDFSFTLTGVRDTVKFCYNDEVCYDIDTSLISENRCHTSYFAGATEMTVSPPCRLDTIRYLGGSTANLAIYYYCNSCIYYDGVTSYHKIGISGVVATGIKNGTWGDVTIEGSCLALVKPVNKIIPGDSLFITGRSIRDTGSTYIGYAVSAMMDLRDSTVVMPIVLER